MDSMKYLFPMKARLKMARRKAKTDLKKLLVVQGEVNVTKEVEDVFRCWAPPRCWLNRNGAPELLQTKKNYLISDVPIQWFMMIYDDFSFDDYDG